MEMTVLRTILYCLKMKHLTCDLEERSQVGLGVWLSRQGLWEGGLWRALGRGVAQWSHVWRPQERFGHYNIKSDEESLKMFR